MSKVTLTEGGLLKTACEAAREAVKEWKAKNPSKSVTRYEALPKCLFDHGCGKGNADLYEGESGPANDPKLKPQNNTAARASNFGSVEKTQKKSPLEMLHLAAAAFIKAKGGGRLGFIFNTATGKITKVAPNSGAAKAGIKKGDIFHRISGELVKEAQKDQGVCLSMSGNMIFMNGVHIMAVKDGSHISDKYILDPGVHIPESGIIVKGGGMEAVDGKLKLTFKRYRPGQYAFPDLVFGKVGSVARVTIVRDGKEIEFKVVRGK